MPADHCYLGYDCYQQFGLGIDPLSIYGPCGNLRHQIFAFPSALFEEANGADATHSELPRVLLPPPRAGNMKLPNEAALKLASLRH